MLDPSRVGPQWFTDKVARGDLVIIDGATGTGLEAAGVPMVSKGWSVLAQLEYPEILTQLHLDYIEAGASAIITNTFAAGRHLLEPGGLGDRVEDAHRLAVSIAHEARDRAERDVVIAGSISSYMADDTDPEWLGRLADTYREQVSYLAEAGVDVIALEMMEHPELCGPAVDAALGSGLPVWFGTSARSDGQRLLSSYEPADIDFVDNFTALMRDEVGIVFVMHTPVPDVSRAVAGVREHWSGPIGAYPESGYFVEPNWQFVDIITPADLVSAAGGWVDSGVRLLGGCCGLGVEHIEALAGLLNH